MLALESVCAGIVLLFVGAKLLTEPKPLRFCLRMLVLVAASWIAECSVIEAYGFYHYSPDWSFFVGHVPALIVCIWPVVIHSAWDLARAILGPEHRAVPPLVGVIVLADASLIEPIAVHANLWWWTEPGLFEVPIIGILGWALFATLAVFAFERGRRAAHFIVLAAVPLATHALLLATWWGALRWLHGTVPTIPVVAFVWIASVGIAIVAVKRRWRQRVPLRDMLLRVPGAAFFFVLLATTSPPTTLVVYALAFAPPYLALVNPK